MELIKNSSPTPPFSFRQRQFQLFLHASIQRHFLQLRKRARWIWLWSKFVKQTFSRARRAVLSILQVSARCRNIAQTFRPPFIFLSWIEIHCIRWVPFRPERPSSDGCRVAFFSLTRAPAIDTLTVDWSEEGKRTVKDQSLWTWLSRWIESRTACWHVSETADWRWRRKKSF